MEPLRTDDPDRVGGYRLLGRLGGGGMGQVYLGRSAGGRPVAVKLIRPEYGADPGFRRRFAAEVEAARRVGGFFTAQVVDADPEADRPWLVTAYVPGPSLGAAVDEHGALPAAAVRVLGAGLAEGLAAIHGCGLVHRDLKPANVILAADGPRVIDFGISRALEGTSATASGVIVGTPAYMSPEQVRGDRDVGPASDVFSLGSVLAFAATGTAPFGAGHPSAMLYRIVQEQPDLSRVPGELRELVAGCLAKHPGERPEVADVLRRCAGADTGDGWLPAPVTAMITAAEPPPGSTVPDEMPRDQRGRGLGRFLRRRRHEDTTARLPSQARAGTGRVARGESTRSVVARGWNGLAWGATISDFTARFPGASQQNGDWWVTGRGPESFCGVEMAVQYAFNDRDELCLVAFYPEVEDRKRLSVAVLNELGAPDGDSTSWTIGDVEVEVKVAGIAASLAHRRFGSR